MNGFNLMEVYSIARDRIAMVNAQNVNASTQGMAKPRTREQQHIQRMHEMYSHQMAGKKQTGFLDTLMEGENEISRQINTG